MGKPAVSTTEMAVAVRCALGGVDVLINNAAIYAGLRQRRFEEIPESKWDRVMSVNVKGVWMATRAIVPLLREARGGAIVNVSSATAMSGPPNWLHYVASKGSHHRHDPSDSRANLAATRSPSTRWLRGSR